MKFKVVCLLALASVSTFAATRASITLTGTLGAVHTFQHAGFPGAVRNTTEAEVLYTVPCTETLERFDFKSIQREDGGYDLLVRAVATRNIPQPGQAVCQSIQSVTKKIQVPGVVFKDAIHLVNLTTTPMLWAPTTRGYEPVDLSIESVRELCPPGEECLWNGTVVTIRTSPVSCLSQLGLFANVYGKAKNPLTGKWDLAVSALELTDTRPVGCAVQARTYEVTLPYVGITQNDLNLIVLGAKPAVP